MEQQEIKLGVQLQTTGEVVQQQLVIKTII
jgi:hypothetical protein